MTAERLAEKAQEWGCAALVAIFFAGLVVKFALVMFEWATR